MNIRVTAVLAALLLTSAACAGTDAGITEPGVTAQTAIDASQKKAAALKRRLITPTASADTGTFTKSSTSTQSSTSTGPGLSGLAIVSDDFTRYSSTANLLSYITVNAGGTGAWNNSFYSSGIAANLIQLDSTVLYNGHATMKYNQPGGVGSTPQLWVSFPARTHIWYRVKVRFSPGFTTAGTLANTSNAYKLLSWGWSTANGSGRIEITNTTQYQLYENVQNGGTLLGGGNFLMAGNISTEWSDGGWYDYIVEVDHSQPVGVIRLWRAKDGQTPVYMGQEPEQMTDGSSMPLLTNISVGLNFNRIRAPNQNQALWWGEWEVVDGTQHPNPFGVAR
jgi:hypothetical protein